MTDAIFAGGRARAGTSGVIGEVVNPADGTVVAAMGLAGARDVHAAVAAAREAFPDWSTAAPVERSRAP